MFPKIKTEYGIAIIFSAFILATTLINQSWREFVLIADQTIQSIPARTQLASASDGADPGLVGWWKFDEGSGTSAADSSGSGNNGRLINNPLWATGKNGTAISLNGTTQLIRNTMTSGLPVFTMGGKASVAFWVKGSPQDNKIIWAESSNSGSPLYQIIADTTNCTGHASGKICIQIRTNTSNTILLQATAKTVLDNTWHHVVWVDNAGAAGTAVYVDGVKDTNTFTYTPSGTLTSTTDCIGALCRSSNSNFFSGSVDDVRVYNRVLSADEITTLYNNDLSAVGTAPVSDTQTPTTPASPDPIIPILSDPTSTTQGNVTLVTPHLIVADPARNWYGGPNNQLGYDILNLALTRDGNTTDKVEVQWSSDGNVWIGNNNTYTPDIFISVPALPYNVKEFYRIRAKVAVSGSYQYSNWSNILPVVSLYPPNTFTAVAKNRTSVYLTWAYRGAKDRSGQEYELLPGSGYKIERSIDPNFPASNTRIITVSQPYTLIPNPNNNAKKLVVYTDNSVFTDETYYYRVHAFTTVGDGETSKVVSLAPNRLPDPVEYSATYMTADSSNAVAIPFNTNTRGQTGYRIDRSDDSVNWTTIKSSSSILSSNPYVDRGLISGKTYYYRVIATNDVGDSPYNLLKVDVPNGAPANTTQWYVNNSVTGGNNNGASWTNAWHNFSSINWYAIKPGDSIYISGGTSGQIYTETLYVMKGGIEGNQVTIKVGNDSSHHGKITLKNGIMFRAPWVTLNGAKDSSFSFSNLENIVANQNIEVQNPNDNSCIYSSAPEGTRILWIDLNGCGSPTGPQTLEGNTAGVLFRGPSIRGSEIAYNYAHDILGTGLAVSAPADTYGLSAIHHNIIERTHNDFIIGSGGLDIYNNIARNWVRPGIGHPDGFQIWAPYIRIYNNIIHDTPGTLVYIQLQSAASKGVQIFNNIMYWTETEENSAITFSTIANGVTLSDVVIANNLVYNLNKGQLSLNVQQNITPISVRNFVTKNNIFYVPTNPNNSGNFIDFRVFDYSVNDIIYDYNILAGTGSLGIGYKGISYASPEAFNAAFPQYNHNSSLKPLMVNPASFDFRLLSSDTATRNSGADLSSYCTAAYGWSQSNCPLTKDIDGISRPQGSAWDIGAYEYYSGQTVTPPVSTPINGSCSATLNQCLTGAFSDVADTSTNYLWSCLGSNGGTTASCSLPITSVTPPTPTTGDFNNDGLVNSIDLSLMITAWNTNNTIYDLNRDGRVNSLDYVNMVRNWTMV